MKVETLIVVVALLLIGLMAVKNLLQLEVKSQDGLKNENNQVSINQTSNYINISNQIIDNKINNNIIKNKIENKVVNNNVIENAVDVTFFHTIGKLSFPIV